MSKIPAKPPKEKYGPVPAYIPPRTVAMLNWICAPQEEFDVYGESFHRAGKALVNELRDRQHWPNTDVCPVIFLYRHAIELQLKAVLLSGHDIMRIQNKPFPEGEDSHIFKDHNLTRLTPAVRTIFLEVGWNPDQTNTPGLETMDDVERELKVMQDLDPNSFRFRYPLDRQGNPSLDSNFYVEVFKLVEKWDVLLEFLDAANCGLKAMFDGLKYSEECK